MASWKIRKTNDFCENRTAINNILFHSKKEHFFTLFLPLKLLIFRTNTPSFFVQFFDWNRFFSCFSTSLNTPQKSPEEQKSASLSPFFTTLKSLFIFFDSFFHAKKMPPSTRTAFIGNKKLVRSMQNKEKQLMHDISIRQVSPIDTLQPRIRLTQLPNNLHFRL